MHLISLSATFRILYSVILLGIIVILSSCNDEMPISPQEQKVEITTLEPAIASTGDTILIIGQNFDSDVHKNIVLFSPDKQASIISASSTILTIIVPEGAENGPITVKTAGQTAISPVEFQVKIIPVPEMRSFEPETGKPGDIITLHGMNFPTDKTKLLVKIGETAAEVVFASSTQIQFRIPQGSSTGDVHVIINDVTYTLSKKLKVVKSLLAYRNCAISISGIMLDVHSVVEGRDKLTDTLVYRNENQEQKPYNFYFDTYPYNPGGYIVLKKGFTGNLYQFELHRNNSDNSSVTNISIEVDSVTGNILSFFISISKSERYSGNHYGSSSTSYTVSGGAMNRLTQDSYTYDVSGITACEVIEVGYSNSSTLEGAPDPYNSFGSEKSTGYFCVGEANVNIRLLE